MALLNEKVVEQTREIFRDLSEPLEILYFGRKGCELCGHVATFLAELAAIEPRLRVETRDLDADAEEAGRLGFRHAPAMALRRAGDGRWPVRYLGLPAGHEYGAFLRVLVTLSTGRGAPGAGEAEVAAIGREVAARVFVLAA